METKKKGIFSRLFSIFTNRELFAALYLLVAVLWSFPQIGWYMNYPMKALFLWGAAVLAWDLVTKRVMFKGRRVFWLVLLCISYVISIALHTSQVYIGVKHFIYNGILLFVMYAPCDNFETFYKKKLPFINDMLIVICFVAAVISLGMYATRYSHVIVYPDNTTSHQGIFYNRLHGVYTSANTGALFSVVSLALSVVNRLLNKAHFKKRMWFYIVNAVLQVLFFSATLSKGGALAAMALLIASGCFLLYPYLLKRTKKIVAIALSLAFVGGSYFLFQGTMSGARAVMVTLPSIVSSFSEDKDIVGLPGGDPSDSQQEPGEEKDDPINFDRVEDGSDVTNGRTQIWEAGIAAMRDSMLFGIVDADAYNGDTLVGDINEAQLSEDNIFHLKRANGYMHNAVIQILVCAGVVGLLILAVFTVLITKDYLLSLWRLRRSAYYFPLAAVFVLLVVLLSQVPAEGHILFNRQDPFAIIFWLYLGVGAQMLSHFKKKTADTDLFVCDTPYQVVNAINLARNSEKADVYIYDQFALAKEIAENLKKCDLFDNVVLYKKYRAYPSAIQKMVTLYRIAFPKTTLKAHRVGAATTKNYRAVYVTCFTPFTDSVRLANMTADIFQYEDGLGSYCVSDLEDYMRSGVFGFINRFLFGGALTYDIKALYLNHPESCLGSCVDKLVQAPPFQATDEIEKVFGYTENTFYEAPFIYLTQPLAQTAIGEKAGQVEKTILDVVGDKAVLRVHPRQDAGEYAAYTVDTARNLWELECAKQITDDHVLIGAFSTAQFSPKMLFDKEPTVVFTYGLYGELLPTTVQMIDVLKSMYRDPSKIVVADTVDALRAFLEEAAKV